MRSFQEVASRGHGRRRHAPARPHVDSAERLGVKTASVGKASGRLSCAAQRMIACGFERFSGGSSEGAVLDGAFRFQTRAAAEAALGDPTGCLRCFVGGLVEPGCGRDDYVTPNLRNSYAPFWKVTSANPASAGGAPKLPQCDPRVTPKLPRSCRTVAPESWELTRCST